MKVGLEIHQQLATRRKLFCACRPELTEEVRGIFERRLRATGGEDRSVDPAAQFQSQRGLRYRYETTPTSCLVDADEEPPHGLDPEALEIGLEVALALGARVLDEIEIMRKIVIDGSNTTGFQRTALLAVDGSVEIGGRRLAIPTVCLEEDAARRTGENDGGGPLFRLDRLGIGLVEISTGPDIRSGREAREVAEELGALLRATKRVRRGIGTIREDLNVSVDGGARVEIKGVQELRLVAKYVDGEAERQRHLLEVRDRLVDRGASVPHAPVVNLTDSLRGLGTGALSRRMDRGEGVHGVRLVGFAGLLGRSDRDPERLGRELADYARAAGAGGIVHSDEAPATGWDEAALARVRDRLGAGPDDAFVLVATSSAAAADRALEAVRTRARFALEGVPPETRDPLPDGRTRYSRPLPGRDRMYPETDVAPVVPDPARLRAIAASLPESPEALRARLIERYALSPETVRVLVIEDEVERFERLVARGHTPSLAARALARDLPEARAELDSPGPREIDEATVEAALAAVASGGFAKEALAPVFAEWLRGAPTLEAAAERAGARGMAAEELQRLARDVVARNAPLVRERGMGALSALMGELMRDVRGRRDGREVAEALRGALASAVERPTARVS